MTSLKSYADEEDILLLCRDIVEMGPDAFSVHGMTLNAQFSFVSERLYHLLHLPSGCLLGVPLETIVDPRDRGILRETLRATMSLQHCNESDINRGDGSGSSSSGSSSGGENEGVLAEDAGNYRAPGTVVMLRLICGGLRCPGSMSIALGSKGLVVVTRMY